jgi:hypothetical protein
VDRTVALFTVRRPLAVISLALSASIVCSITARAAGPGVAEYARGRALSKRGDHAAALAPLAAVRWRAPDADLRRLAAVDLTRSEASLPDSFRWDWAVLPADNLGSPDGLEDLPFALSWMLRDDLQAAGLSPVAPLARVVRALDRKRDAAFHSRSTPEEASRLPIQTIEGLKARLSLIPGPTGSPLYNGAIDGEAGGGLEDAIRTLQAVVGIAPTGEADASTMGALGEIYERRLLERPPAVDPATVPVLARAIPARSLVRPTMRVRDGRLIFGVVVLDENGRPQYGPVEGAGPLEGAAGIVRETVRDLLERLPAGTAQADRLRIDPPSSMAELQEAGRWALLRARGEASLARTRGQALRDENPGWDRLATTVDADQAGAATIQRWEEAWSKQLLVLVPGDEQPLIDRLDSLVSDLPVTGTPRFGGRRGAIRGLGDEGRLRIEGSFP